MKIGYARVSTREQHLEQQIEALEKYGCERIYTEKVSGQSSKRPVLNQVLEGIREGDELVFWRLDRVGRSLVHLEQTISDLVARGVVLISLKEKLDTDSATGKLMYRIMGAFAEFEIDLIKERTAVGVDQARKKGKRIGRTYKKGTEILMKRCIDMLLEGHSPAEVKKKYGKAPTEPTLYRWKQKYIARDIDIRLHLGELDKKEYDKLVKQLLKDGGE